MKVLQTQALRKIYGAGDTEVRALDGVDLAVENGEFVAVVGTSAGWTARRTARSMWMGTTSSR